MHFFTILIEVALSQFRRMGLHPFYLQFSCGDFWGVAFHPGGDRGCGYTRDLHRDYQSAAHTGLWKKERESGTETETERVKYSHRPSGPKLW
jgi:hypothetical protein